MSTAAAGVSTAVRSPDDMPAVSTRLARRERERRVRLRRTVVLALGVLLAATAVARLAEDSSVASPRSAEASVTVPEQAAAVGSAEPAPPGAPGLPATPPPSAVAAASPGPVEEGADSAATATGTAAPVQQSAQGTLRVLSVPNENPPPTPGRVVRYTVEVEDGITLDGEQFARTVRSTLDDARGWRTAAGVSFVPVPAQEAASGASVDVRVTLATPALTARLCAPLDTSISQLSCWNRGRSVLNLQRWLAGSATYGADLGQYRTYLVNHEVGHGLGLSHQHCPAAGQPAPVMVQQTKSLEGCTPWPWPTRP